MTVKVLAIDDEEGILKVIRRALEREGYEVDTLSDPLKADLSSPGNYDLILLDVMMPGMDGFELLRKIREKADCPILFLTARTGEEDVMTGLGLGADDYIRKPFGIGELRARVEAHIRRENRQKHHAVAIGETKFYLKEKRLLCKEQEIFLTKSEYEICEYLALHQGQVFSRERIYEYVFGFDGEADSSAITEHVKNIRAKFRMTGLEPIETVWGIGYRWKG
ncbi:response regulator transcription factor [Claveliimonas sp.]|uniref:response regulator transcription factor n=1 Tax=Claveliimonas sp. TaxID=3076672 RepID=UPI00307BEB0B